MWLCEYHQYIIARSAQELHSEDGSFLGSVFPAKKRYILGKYCTPCKPALGKGRRPL
jgi:hypothetical protein